MHPDLRAAGLALLLLLPVRPLPAQATDAGVLRFMQGLTEVGRESFRLSPGRLERETVIPALDLQLESVALEDSLGGFVDLSLTLANAAGDSLRGSWRAERRGDSVHVTGQLGLAPIDRTRPADFDLVMPPQSLITFARLARSAEGHDTTYRALVAGPDTILPIAVRFSGDTATLTMAGVELRIGLVQQRVTFIDIPAQRLRALRAEQPESLPPLAGLHRPAPDYSEDVSSPVSAEEVRVPAGTGPDTFSLGCTLTLPRAGHAPFPALVTITGSGGQDRDENLWPLVRDYRLFRQVAERVGAAGIATLRCDDRGIGASGGRRDSATTVDLAADTRAQVEWLRRRREIDPARVALAGHSEGGIIGPMLSAADRKIRAVVILAGPAKSGLEVLVDQARWPVLSTPGLSDSVRAARLRSVESAVRADTLPANPWLRWFIHYDPRPIAGRVRAPVLILQGALDRQVSAGQADTLAALVRAGGNRDVTSRTFPRLNHLFLVSLTDGSPAEYLSLRDPVVPTEVLDLLTGWLSTRLLH